jgi:hypothetical protein
MAAIGGFLRPPYNEGNETRRNALGEGEMMRGFRFAVAAAVFVAVAGMARAGVYCSLDQLPYPVPASHQAVESKLGTLRAVPNKEQEDVNTVRKDYLKRAEELNKKDNKTGLTLDERIDLSGIYLRLNENAKAVDVLANSDQSHFLVQAHLAAAYHSLWEADPQRTILLERAIEHQKKAIAAWPAVWPNLALRWSPEQLTWYRRAERYYLELLKIRQQQARTNPQNASNALDPLFPGLRTEVDENYQVGGPPLQRVERLPEEVPPDARQLVAQLMWWRPFDNQLYWLYGELLNYNGDVANAAKVLNAFYSPENKTRKLNNQMLRRHAFDLAEHAGAWANPYGILYAAAPRALPADGAAGAFQEAALLAALTVGEKVSKGELTGGTESVAPPKTGDLPPPSGAPPAKAANSSWLLDWRTAAVGFVAGLFVMALLQFQWREWSRRRERVLAGRRELTS